MTSLRGDTSSREPLLWVQLLGLAAWPLEALGLLLLLAGGDPGPFPLVERLFCWGLGAVLPAVPCCWCRCPCGGAASSNGALVP